MEAPADTESTKRSLINKPFWNSPSASPLNIRVFPPESSNRHTWSEYIRPPPSRDESFNKRFAMYGSPKSPTRNGWSEYIQPPPLRDELVNKRLAMYGSQSYTQFELPPSECEIENVTTHVGETDARPKSLMHRCTVYASLNSGYSVQETEARACYDHGCSFCAIILNCFTAVGQSFNGGFSLRIESPKNIIRVTNAFALFQGSVSNIEMFRSVEATENMELSESTILPKELVTSWSEESGAFDLDLSWIGTRPDVAENHMRTECLHQARIWLQQCHEQHSTCAISQDKDQVRYPKHVIDISDVNVPRLRYFEDIDTEDKSYVTLSHCWGGHQTYRTERSSLPYRLQGMPWEDIPKTFQDAIIVARYLGINYIWIDSLCIVQDDNDDWAQESAKMSSIYANAVLTIAASATPDDTYGFLHRRTYRSVQVYPYGNQQSDHVFKARISIHRDLSQPGPLLKRAWVLQERCLSRRVLFFEEHEMTWECRKLEDCECGSDLREAKYKPTKSRTIVHAGKYSDSIRNTHAFTFDGQTAVVPNSETFAWWRKTIVSRYSALALTRWTDRLPALSGLASTVRNKTKDTYLAGIWSADLCSGLLWRIVTWGSINTAYLAPSWSWASHIGQVEYDWFPLQVSLAKLIDYQTILATVDPTGYVHSAKLRLECPTNKLRTTGAEALSRPSSLVGTGFLFDGYCLMQDEQLCASHFFLDAPCSSISEATFAYVGLDIMTSLGTRKIRVAGIILAPWPHDPKVYRRLGCWEIVVMAPNVSAEHMCRDSWRHRTVYTGPLGGPMGPRFTEEIVIE